jgi:U3 small nucleolar ribonucleoprotein protein LCP5
VIDKSQIALEKGGNEKENPIVTKHGMSYLEMKYNLMLNYNQLLSFYLLLKLKGKKVENHPVIKRLLHIKSLFEKLRPLDQKLVY